MSCREGQLIRSLAGYAHPAAEWQRAQGCFETRMLDLLLCYYLNRKNGADLETCQCRSDVGTHAGQWQMLRIEALGVVYGMMPHLALCSKAAYFSLQELCQFRNLMQRGI